jgi:regulatory protein
MAGRITALRHQKHDSERINVYLDGEYAFALPALLAAALQVGQEMNDDQIAALQAEDAEEQAHNRALRFLSYRPRSVAEVRQNLEKHRTSPDVVELVIQRLLAAGYVDDQAFARQWVADRERFRPRAPVALRQELRLKGVPDDIIAQALVSLDSESSAYHAGATYARRLSTLDQRVYRQKLGAYLLRRGFQHDDVWPVVDRLWQEQRDDTDSGQQADEGI